MAKHSEFRNTIEFLLVRAVLANLRYLPRESAEAMARLYTSVLDWTVPRLRQTAIRNLELAMPQLGPRERRCITDGTFHTLARHMVAIAKLPDIDASNIGEWIRYEGFENYQLALDRGKGVLIVTGHLGAWELSAHAHALMSAPMWVVARPLDNPKLDAHSEYLRTLSGNRVIGRNEYVRPILAALKKNQAIGVFVDQNMTADRGVFVDFFGRKACVESGVAKIAARTGAAVLPGFAVWSPGEGKYVLRFYEVLDMQGDAVADTQRIQSALERAVRDYPDQWLWIHRRWKTRPPGEEPIYR